MEADGTHVHILLVACLISLSGTCMATLSSSSVSSLLSLVVVRQSEKDSSGTTVPHLWEMGYRNTRLAQRHRGCVNLIDWENN